MKSAIEKIVRDTVPQPYADRCLEGLRDFLSVTEGAQHTDQLPTPNHTETDSTPTTE